MDSSKVEVISKLSVPNFQRDVWSYLGFVGYYIIFIEKITKISSPRFEFITKYCEFNWNIDFQKEFETLKEKIS